MTAALITVYFPTAEVCSNILAAARQADLVFLCDNSPHSNARLFADLPENVRYVFFGENLGISAAYNRVLKDTAVGWRAEDILIFFDQDSLIAPGHLQQMQKDWVLLQQTNGNPGCLGPAFYNAASGAVESVGSGMPVAEGIYSVGQIMTSSMLTDYGTLQSVDFWNEDVFLDMADWDLCWRLREKGMVCCRTDNVILQHKIGEGERHFGFLRLREGKPVREYYQLRECLRLLGKAYTPWRFRLRFIAMVLIRSPLHVLFLGDRKVRLRYICKGIGDFFRGKKGALEAPETKETQHSL